MISWLASDVERLLTARGGFNLHTASPLQRAICRVSMGRPLADLWANPLVRQAFADVMPTEKPREFGVFSGVRVGKTLIASAHAVHWSQVVDVSRLRPGEIPRIPVVSLTKDLAKVAYGHIVGSIMDSPMLRQLVMEDPKDGVVVLRHPTGRPVEIMVTAGSRAGGSVSARWLAGCIFDEFPKMMGAEEGTINWDHMRGEALFRILPGGGMFHIGSPWSPHGPAYDAFNKYHGAPDKSFAVVKAPAYVMNPVIWTPEVCAEFKRTNPDLYATQVEAEFAAEEGSLFSTIELDRVTRKDGLDIEPEPGMIYTAAMDPGLTRNAWTLIIATTTGQKRRVVCARQWVGTKLDPLVPREVAAQIAPFLRKYRCQSVMTDQYYIQAVRDDFRQHGVSVLEENWTVEEETEHYLSFRNRLANEEIELPNDPYVRADLQKLRRRTTATGVKVIKPISTDGRHCDYASAIVLALSRWLVPKTIDTPLAGTRAAFEAEERKIERQLLRESFQRRRNFYS